MCKLHPVAHPKYVEAPQEVPYISILYYSLKVCAFI